MFILEHTISETKCFIIDLKILLITSQALHDLSPSYISDLLVSYVAIHTLRSLGRGPAEVWWMQCEVWWMQCEVWWMQPPTPYLKFW